MGHRRLAGMTEWEHFQQHRTASYLFEITSFGGALNLLTTLSTTLALAVEPQLSNSIQPQAPLVRPGPAWRAPLSIAPEDQLRGAHGSRVKKRSMALGDNDYRHAHGYIFEVLKADTATAEPLRDMGRFVHEAIAVDPATGIVYETEDRRNSGFYRFLPTEINNLAAGGQLEILALADRNQADLRGRQTPFVWHPVSWVPIDDPEPANPSDNSVFSQGFTVGGATFARLECTWYGNERVYIVATDGGTAEAGQIWDYDPTQERLRLIYESPNVDTLNMPDNICVSPRGGLVLCEDTEPDNFIRALSVDGSISPFAKNNVVLDGEINGFTGDFRNREFAGATFSPDENWPFFQCANTRNYVCSDWTVG